MTKKETIAHWKNRIAQSDRWAIRAAQRILRVETDDQHVDKGLNRIDRVIVVSILSQPTMTRKQLNTLRKVMPKYAGQLYRITHEGKEDDTCNVGC